MRAFFLLFLLSACPAPETAPDPRGEALRLQSRASDLVAQNREEEALHELTHALQLAREAGDPALQAAILTKTGSVQLFLGDHGAAAASLETALSLYANASDPKGEALAWGRVAQAYVAMGAYDAAAGALQKARALGHTEEDPAANAVAEAVRMMQLASQEGPSTAFLRSFDKKLDLLAGGRLMCW